MPADRLWALLFAAWIVALAATLGALFIGEVMGQAPCILCWYQRAFMFPLAMVLAVGAFRADPSTWTYALPLAIVGGSVAAYHALLYAGVLAEALEPCGQGPSCTDAAMTIFGVMPLPFLSLAAFGDHHSLVTHSTDQNPMNRRATIIFTALAAIAVFAAGTYFYSRSTVTTTNVEVVTDGNQLVRPHSPVLGPASAPVTIVEFFDPSCEACRAFYPTVKQIMATYPRDVRVVIRYTPFHPASEEAVRILEAARKQDRFQRVMEWLLQNQAAWGADGNPQPARAWDVAQEAGLDVAKAKQDASTSDVTAVITQDKADVQAVGVTGTPTFFVNEKPLPSFGKQQLIDAVAQEVEALKPKS